MAATAINRLMVPKLPQPTQALASARRCLTQRENVELEDVGERLLRQQLLVGEAFERLDDLSAGGRLLGHGQVAFADLASLEADDVDDRLEQELGGLVDRGPGHVEAQSCLESTTT